MPLMLRIKAPFAAFRPMNAGWFRPSAGMLTPSAAYGLILNFAAIDSRIIETDENHDGKTPASLTRADLPAVKLALGIPRESSLPVQQTVLQQLHNYPIGKDAGVPKEWAKGNKNNITPVKREYLSDIDAVIAVEAEDDLYTRIKNGLAGAFNGQRYGLPFLGDNSFLLDSAECLCEPIETRWYERLEKTRGKQARINDAVRLTVNIDRTGFSGTRSALFLPNTGTSLQPPTGAWCDVGG